MTKELFEKLLEDNDISWNDKIVITILNPFRKWYEFWKKPKIFKFNGYLLYHIGDEIVFVSVIDENGKTIDIHFDFNEIINIESYE